MPRIQGGSTGVHPLIVLFATLAGTALYGIVGAIFAVPVVAIVSATLRYLRGTLLFERWGKPPVKPAEEESEKQESDTPSKAAGMGRTGSDEEDEG